MTLTSPTATGSKGTKIYDLALSLLQALKKLDLHVSGIAFENNEDSSTAVDYNKMVGLSKLIISSAKQTDAGNCISSINLGAVLNPEQAEGISEHFGSGIDGIQFKIGISRLITESAFTLFTKVIGKSEGSEKRTYVLNDGVFGSFVGILTTDNPLSTPHILSCLPREDQSIGPCDFLGPSGHDLDVIGLGVPIERDLDVGDWVAFHDIGHEIVTPAASPENIEATVLNDSKLRLFDFKSEERSANNIVEPVLDFPDYGLTAKMDIFTDLDVL